MKKDKEGIASSIVESRTLASTMKPPQEECAQRLIDALETKDAQLVSYALNEYFMLRIKTISLAPEPT
jgi:hypothetical protein